LQLLAAVGFLVIGARLLWAASASDGSPHN
jgi:hypothetical protein